MVDLAVQGRPVGLALGVSLWQMVRIGCLVGVHAIHILLIIGGHINHDKLGKHTQGLDDPNLELLVRIGHGRFNLVDGCGSLNLLELASLKFIHGGALFNDLLDHLWLDWSASYLFMELQTIFVGDGFVSQMIVMGHLLIVDFPPSDGRVLLDGKYALR